MTDAAAPRRNPSTLIFLLGAVVALSHLTNEWVKAPIPWGPAWKCAGIAILGLYALRERAIAVGLGLILSAVGDVLLELDGAFIGGMAAFGLAHVCYIAAFVGVIRRDGVSTAAWPIAALVLIISIGLGWWLMPGMSAEGLLIPATIYQVVISAMVITAVMSKAPLMAKLGAAIFMLSDSLIAVGMFAKIAVIPGSVWITYAAAQIMLAWSMTHLPKRTVI